MRKPKNYRLPFHFHPPLCWRWHFLSCLLRETAPDGHAGGQDLFVPKLHEPVLDELAQADFLKELRLPAVLRGNVGALARNRAAGAAVEASRTVCEEIREIEKLTALEELRLHMTLEPERFRYFHF